MNALLHLNPVFWLILAYLCGSGVEWLSSVRRFRKLQSNYPRFTYLEPEDKEVNWIMGWSFLLMIISGVMAMVSLVGASSGELIAFIVLLPFIICLMVIGDNVNSGKQIVSWKSLALLGTLVMEIGSVATTVIFYMTSDYLRVKTLSEFIPRLAEMTLVNVGCLSAVFVLAGIFAIVTKNCGQDPIEGALKKHLRWLPVFNPVLSPITIPLTIAIVPTFLFGKWAIRSIWKIVVGIKQKEIMASAIVE